MKGSSEHRLGRRQCGLGRRAGFWAGYMAGQGRSGRPKGFGKGVLTHSWVLGFSDIIE